MKKVVVALCFLLVALTATAETSGKANITFYPVGLAFGVLNAGYEFPVSPVLPLPAQSASAELNGFYFNYGDWLTGFGAGARYSHYLDPEMKGIYYGAVVGAGLYTWKWDHWDYTTGWEDKSESTFGLSFGVTGGYKHKFTENFYLSNGLTLQANIVSAPSGYEGDDLGSVGFGLDLLKCHLAF